MCMKEAANAQPLLAVKCDVFAVGVAGGVTPTPAHFCSRSQDKLDWLQKAAVCM